MSPNLLVQSLGFEPLGGGAPGGEQPGVNRSGGVVTPDPCFSAAIPPPTLTSSLPAPPRVCRAEVLTGWPSVHHGARMLKGANNGGTQDKGGSWEDRNGPVLLPHLLGRLSSLPLGQPGGPGRGFPAGALLWGWPERRPGRGACRPQGGAQQSSQPRLAMDESTGGNDRVWMCVVAGGAEGPELEMRLERSGWGWGR